MPCYGLMLHAGLARTMNYRHKYHAGNFADVVKHLVLALVIERLKLKETAFRVIDTHAGIGSYDLTADAAQKTGEWRGGIGLLIGPDAAPIPAKLAALLAPYLDAVRALNPGAGLRHYPGSPRLAQLLMRPQMIILVHPFRLVATRPLWGLMTTTAMPVGIPVQHTFLYVQAVLGP